MNKYFYKITEAIFEPPKDVEYSEVDHKVLNEEVKNTEIIVNASNVIEAAKKAEGILNEIVTSQFSNFPKITFYKFALSIFRVEEVNSS